MEAEGLLDYQGRSGIISIVRWNLRPVIFGVDPCNTVSWNTPICSDFYRFLVDVSDILIFFGSGAWKREEASEEAAGREGVNKK